MIPCSFCGSLVPSGAGMCPTCGTWSGTGAQALVSREAQLVLASEVKTVELERVAVGGGWDRALGGGVPLDTEIILSGPAGSGKSTVAIHRLGDYLAARPAQWGYYLSSEQGSDKVLHAFRQILGQVPDRLIVPKTSDGGAYLPPAFLAKHPPIVVVVDSVTGFCGKDQDAAVNLCKYFKHKIAVAHRCIVILIFHQNKEGDVAGKYTAMHDCDQLTSMDHPERSDPPQFRGAGDYRKFEVWKNRAGPALTTAWYKMTGSDGAPGSYKGLEEVPEKQEREIGGATGLRRAVLELLDLRDEFKEAQEEYRENLEAAEKRLLMLATDPKNEEDLTEEDTADRLVRKLRGAEEAEDEDDDEAHCDNGLLGCLPDQCRCPCEVCMASRGGTEGDDDR